MKRIFNFSAGPSILPTEVFIEAAGGVLNYKNIGRSILEISHRGPEFTAVLDEARNLVRELLDVGDDYEVLFLTGGASAQFYQVPMNLLPQDGKAAYVDSGVWSSKAIKEAKIYGETFVTVSGSKDNYSKLPDEFEIPDDAAYLHMTSNNTIYGTQFREFPDTKVPLICDMSSDIFSRPIRVSQFGMIYAGAQKNLGPAGTTLVIIRKDLIGKNLRPVPSFLDYKKVADAGSMLNTPPVFPIYVSMLNLRWLKAFGGVQQIFTQNKEKARILYDELDNNKLFTAPVRTEDRSLMNVVFDINKPELSEEFLKYCEQNGCVGLKGHRSRGGFRASIYNAMGLEGIEALVTVLRNFENEHA